MLLHLHTHTKCFPGSSSLIAYTEIPSAGAAWELLHCPPTACTTPQNGGWVCCVGNAALDKQLFFSPGKYESKVHETCRNTARNNLPVNSALSQSHSAGVEAPRRSTGDWRRRGREIISDFHFARGTQRERRFWRAAAALRRLLGVLLPVDIFPSARVRAEWKGGVQGVMDISWEIMAGRPKRSPNLKWTVVFNLIACD